MVDVTIDLRNWKNWAKLIAIIAVIYLLWYFITKINKKVEEAKDPK